jgi:hypothetical protein
MQSTYWIHNPGWPSCLVYKLSIALSLTKLARGSQQLSLYLLHFMWYYSYLCNSLVLSIFQLCSPRLLCLWTVVGVVALDTRKDLEWLSPNEISVGHHESIADWVASFDRPSDWCPWWFHTALYISSWMSYLVGLLIWFVRPAKDYCQLPMMWQPFRTCLPIRTVHLGPLSSRLCVD